MGVDSKIGILLHGVVWSTSTCIRTCFVESKFGGFGKSIIYGVTEEEDDDLLY